MNVCAAVDITVQLSCLHTGALKPRKCVHHPFPVTDKPKTDKPKTTAPTYKQGITLDGLDQAAVAGPDYSAVQRNLALELVRVTEAAALAAGRWFGKGDKNAADQVRTTAAYHRLGLQARRLATCLCSDLH